ncbi:DUF881 domain-containing protein [Clostridium sp.]|uniref:DUF881 domain-containing protein n=1 Tax=Clostridium sp. TaxID=1506 RepID=UPI001A4CBAD1|nr:DUF881 domain-containing protein [Clostridium sp.]MBK5241274.1 DUF881 domain-containing protein [Clostridium sp.]
MKKFRAQISIGLICALLGFMITYQLKVLNKQNTAATDVNKNTPEIITENVQLKKQIEETKKKISELEAKTSEYESAASGRDQESKLLYEALNESRILTGGTEVEGEGVIIYIDPRIDIFDSSIGETNIRDVDLVHIRNELNAVDAEAISINGIRLTSRSAIRTGGNAIIINDERIPSNERITINVIGNKKLLVSAMEFPGTLSEQLLNSFTIKTTPTDKVLIPKYNKTYKFEFAKPVEKE